MILKAHVESHNRMKKYLQEPMLMLGNQENTSAYNFGIPYTTLDPDEGDISWNLNKEIPKTWIAKYGTVYNLGTLEHVWDVHQAFTNAVKLIRMKGVYIHHSPCAGYENHGIHILDWNITLEFFKLNGFLIRDSWFTLTNGTVCGPPVRNCGKNILFWFVAVKVRELDSLVCPQQAYLHGRKLKLNVKT